MKILIAAGLVLALSGCVAEKTVMQNANGQRVYCNAYGFGIIGAPVAMAAHSNCVNNMHAAGYFEGAPPTN